MNLACVLADLNELERMWGKKKKWVLGSERHGEREPIIQSIVVSWRINKINALKCHHPQQKWLFCYHFVGFIYEYLLLSGN